MGVIKELYVLEQSQLHVLRKVRRETCMVGKGITVVKNTVYRVAEK
jgi:hypothetical protein